MPYTQIIRQLINEKKEKKPPRIITRARESLDVLCSKFYANEKKKWL